MVQLERVVVGDVLYRSDITDSVTTRLVFSVSAWTRIEMCNELYVRQEAALANSQVMSLNRGSCSTRKKKVVAQAAVERQPRD